MYAFLLVQTFYWLALATWFGSVIVVAIAAPVIIRTVAEADPILPDVMRVNLEREHSSLLAGSIVGSILQALATVQYGCAAVLLIMLVAQWGVMIVDGHQVVMAIARDAFFVAAAVLLVYDRRILWPKAWAARQEYIDHADEPDIANPAKDRFDRHHRDSMRILFAIVSLLSLMIVSSAGIRPGW